MKRSEFLRLQKEWYDKLRADGFSDVEGGIDLNKMHASTLPGVNHRKGRFHIARGGYSGPEWKWLELLEAERIAGGHAQHFADTELAQAWRLFSQKANDLEAETILQCARKAFLLSVSERGYIDRTELHHYGMKYSQALRTFGEFCESIGLPRTHLLNAGRKKGTRIKRDK